MIRRRYAAGRQYLKELYAVSYTHLRAHETVLDLVCRLLLEKKNHDTNYNPYTAVSVHTKST